MSLKQTVLDLMRRDDLKPVVDAAGLKGVDRRSVQSGTPAADAAGEQGAWNASSCQTSSGMRCAASSWLVNTRDALRSAPWTTT